MLAGCGASPGAYVVFEGFRLPAVYVTDIRTVVVQPLVAERPRETRPVAGERSHEPAEAAKIAAELADALTSSGDYLAAPVGGAVTAAGGVFSEAERKLVVGARRSGLAEGIVLARLESFRLRYASMMRILTSDPDVKPTPFWALTGELKVRLRLVNLRSGLTVIDRTETAVVAREAAERANLPEAEAIVAGMRTEVVTRFRGLLASGRGSKRMMLRLRSGEVADLRAVELARAGRWREALDLWKDERRKLAAPDPAGRRRGGRGGRGVRAQTAIVESNIGVACEVLRLYDEARAHYRRAVALEPSERAHRKNLEMVEKMIATIEKRAEVASLRGR